MNGRHHKAASVKEAIYTLYHLLAAVVVVTISNVFVKLALGTPTMQIVTAKNARKEDGRAQLVNQYALSVKKVVMGMRLSKWQQALANPAPKADMMTDREVTIVRNVSAAVGAIK